MKTLLIFLSTTLLLLFDASAQQVFLENRGQIKDQDHHSRGDIDYSLRSKGLTAFIGKGHLNYQFATPSGNTNTEHFDVDIYRLDVTLLNYCKNAILMPEDKQAYYENYYLPGCNGVRAHSCKRLVYKNIYPAIDQVLYLMDGKLEQDFIVNPGGDPSNIRLRYSGASTLCLSSDGSLIATTPMGTVTEHAPRCYSFGGGMINATYRLDSNIVSFNIPSYKDGVIIDPSIVWGTYYGTDTSGENAYSVSHDHSGAVYIAGYTTSAYANTIATTGAHQTIYGGGQYDALLVKMDTNGVTRQWATYYGGSGTDQALAVNCSNGGDVYIAGTTTSSNNIATPGSQQALYGDSSDAFLVKFNSAGVRQWGTYCGGIRYDGLSGMCCDSSGNILITGETNSPSGIATAGSYQQFLAGGKDAFIAKYSSGGIRLWGTYYGGSNDDGGDGICTDTQGNIYLSGSTNSTSNIATAGSYQTILHGFEDGFLVKFNAAGSRQWGTYYGGETNLDVAASVACDKTGNVFLAGYTPSLTGISTPNCFQSTNSGGNADAFLSKFSSLGVLQWATYYGGAGNESINTQAISVDDSGFVYMVGLTSSTTGMATTGAYQLTYGGDITDGLIVRFNSAGERAGATYYGGSARDVMRACVFYDGNLYVAGVSYSTNNIATPGTFKSVFTGGGYYNAVLAKFAFSDTAMPNPVGIKESTLAAQDDVHVYPNPSNGSFIVNGVLRGEEKISLEIINEAGLLIYRGAETLSSNRINNQIKLNAAAGKYIMRLKGRNKTRTLSFVIQ